MSEAHRGIVALRPSFVADRLHLPEGTVIVGVRMNPFHGGLIELMVEHPALHPVHEGELSPTVSYAWRSEYLT